MIIALSEHNAILPWSGTQVRKEQVESEEYLTKFFMALVQDTRVIRQQILLSHVGTKCACLK